MLKKVLIVLITGIIFITGCGCEKQDKVQEEQSDKYIANENILEDTKVGDIEIYNVDMELFDEGSVFEIYLKNTSNETIEIKKINIYFKDKNGNLLLNGPRQVEYYSPIEPDESQILTVMFDINLSNATSVEYELVNE